MPTREEIQTKMESGLAASEKQIQKMKKDLEAAGDSASDEAKEALAEAEQLWEKGKVKYDEIAAATDEQFEELADSAAQNWQELSTAMESGWSDVKNKFKEIFS